MASKSDQDLQEFADELWDIVGRIIHNSRSSLFLEDEMEISIPQAILLLEIFTSGTISMSELSRRIQTTQGVATRMVDRLLEKGLLERKRDSKDRRVVLVSTSKRGGEIAGDLKRAQLENMKEIFGTISRKEREDFLRFLEKIADQMEQSSEIEE